MTRAPPKEAVDTQPLPKDDELLAGCLAGRREAWDLFVDRYARLVHWSVRRTLAGTAYAARADLAEDLFQDVFRRLLGDGQLERLRDLKSLPRYLSVLACHLTLDRVRSLARGDRQVLRPSLDLEAPPDPPAPGGPVDEILERERRDLLAEALGALGARERFCVEMHYLHEKTHREIAQVLGLPQDTVSAVIRRTREKLRRGLEQRGLGENP